MPDATAVVSREQLAIGEFNNAMSHLRSELERPEDRESVAALTEAMLAFGVCELRMRRSERLQAVGLHTTEAKELAASALAENKRGLAMLPRVRPLIKRFSSEETDEKALAAWREASTRLRQEWREQVAELDIEAVKARQLLRMADEVCDAVDTGGLAGLGQHLTERLTELGKLRRSKSRGTEAESFPWWKIVAAAITWGFGVGIMFLLIMFRAGPLAMFGWWFMIGIMTFCIAIGC
jgi:hypothetical protein